MADYCSSAIRHGSGNYTLTTITAACLLGYGLACASEPVFAAQSRNFHPATQVASEKPNSNSIFHALAEKWKADTLNISSITELISNPAYLQIIGMGKAALPFLLSELDHSPGHWFPALKAISGEDPVTATDIGNITAMRDAWLTWGKQRGLI